MKAIAMSTGRKVQAIRKEKLAIWGLLLRLAKKLNRHYSHPSQ